MNINISIVIFFLSLFIINQTKAQTKDYVVLKTGDTLKGDFRRTTEKFRVSDTEGYKSLDPKKVATFYRSKDSVCYVSAVIPLYARPIFLKLILNGRVQLLQYFTVSPGTMGGPRLQYNNLVYS